MVKSIASGVAKNLGNILDSEENVESYAYALELVLMSVLNLILVILVALFLRIIPTTLAFLAVFIPFRTFGGGVHLSRFSRCFAIGSCLMLGSAYLAAKINMQSYQLTILFLFTLLFTLLCIIRWVPASTVKNPINDSSIVRIQKRNMFIAAMVWTGCITTFIFTSHSTLALAMILGAIVGTVLISPLGFRLMGFIDGLLNHLGKGVTDS